MTYYIVRSPVSGQWMKAPYRGFGPNMPDAYPYAANSAHLANVARAAKLNGRKLILRQVMVAEDA